jgi:hypothetical protein
MVSRNRMAQAQNDHSRIAPTQEVKKLYDAQLAYDPKKHGELVYDVSEMRVLLNTVMILAKKGKAPAFK